LRGSCALQIALIIIIIIMHVKHYCLGSGGSRTSDFGRKLQVSLSLPFSSPLILPFASSPSHSIPRLTASEINLLRSPPNSLAWFQNLLLTLICTHLGGMGGGRTPVPLPPKLLLIKLASSVKISLHSRSCRAQPDLQTLLHGADQSRRKPE